MATVPIQNCCKFLPINDVLVSNELAMLIETPYLGKSSWELQTGTVAEQALRHCRDQLLWSICCGYLNMLFIYMKQEFVNEVYLLIYQNILTDSK